MSRSSNFSTVLQSVYAIRLAIVASLVLVGGWLLPQSLLAQDDPGYETLDIAPEYQMPADASDKTKRNEVAAKRRNMQRQITDTLKGRGGNTGDVEGWFTGYVFPEMTQLDDTTLARLGEMRQRFFKFYLEDTNSQNLRNDVIGYTIPVMRRIAEGNFHPACRVNAMLLLGRLNSREGNRSAGVMPQPVPEMSAYLLQIATSADQPEYLRINALTGLIRHSNLRGLGSSDPFSAADLRQMGDAMVNLIGQQPSDSLSKEAAYWMKRQAIQILGNLGSPGDNARYAKALRDVIVDDKEILLVRTEAAEAYANLEFTDANQADVADMTEIIGNLVVTAANADAEYLEQRALAMEFIAQFLDGKDAGDTDEEDVDAPGPNRGMGGPDAMDGPGAQAKKKKNFVEVVPVYQRELVRRRFKSYLWSGRIALVGADRAKNGGLSRFASDDDKAFIADLIKEFEDVMLTTDVREPEEPKDGEEDKDEDEKDGLGGLDEEEQEEPMTLADQLKKALTEGASNINSAIVKHRPPADAGADAGGLPADDGDDARGDSAPPQGNN